MIVYIEEPKRAFNSNLIVNDESDHFESTFDPRFQDCNTTTEIKERLQHMEDNHLHIRNDRGMVFGSYEMIKEIEELERTKFMFRMLTRTCGLRQAAYRAIMGYSYESQNKE